MERQREKMVALMQLSRLLPQHPGLFMLLGFLAARLQRLHFVANPDQADPQAARILLAARLVGRVTELTPGEAAALAALRAAARPSASHVPSSSVQETSA